MSARCPQIMLMPARMSAENAAAAVAARSLGDGRNADSSTPGARGLCAESDSHQAAPAAFGKLKAKSVADPSPEEQIAALPLVHFRPATVDLSRALRLAGKRKLAAGSKSVLRAIFDGDIGLKYLFGLADLCTMLQVEHNGLFAGALEVFVAHGDEIIVGYGDDIHVMQINLDVSGPVAGGVGGGTRNAGRGAERLFDGNDQALVDRGGCMPHRGKSIVVHRTGAVKLQRAIRPRFHRGNGAGPVETGGRHHGVVSEVAKDESKLITLGGLLRSRKPPHCQSKDRKQEECSEHGDASFGI